MWVLGGALMLGLGLAGGEWLLAGLGAICIALGLLDDRGQR